jgi:hypothetical protein
MQEEGYSLPLALLDYVPSIAFLLGSYFLVKTMYLERGSRCARMGMTGSLLILIAGLLKATWKLLFTLKIADITLFSDSQFALLALGFLALLVAVVMLARQKPVPQPALTLAMAAWKIPLLFIMTLCSLGAQGILCYVSFRRGARLAAWCFICGVLCMLGMSGMASGSEQTVANQWIEESMNTVWQILFAIGCWLLYKNYRTAQTA